jgi:cellulose synthase/poly-beta-1,6-N-acetylglucosamine synthase-like glycosyltransferase
MVDFPNNVVDRSLARRHGVTLGAIAKNEGRYLPEWIAYHLAIGFDRIVVYSNDPEDNQNEVLEAIARGDSRPMARLALSSCRFRAEFGLSRPVALVPDAVGGVCRSRRICRSAGRRGDT